MCCCVFLFVADLQHLFPLKCTDTPVQSHRTEAGAHHPWQWNGMDLSRQFEHSVPKNINEDKQLWLPTSSEDDEEVKLYLSRCLVLVLNFWFSAIFLKTQLASFQCPVAFHLPTKTFLKPVKCQRNAKVRIRILFFFFS